MENNVRSPAAPEEPLRLPGSPFWNVFKGFGRDEMIALCINVIGTVVAGFFVSSVFLLALVGPVIEKVGFYIAHVYEASLLYRATPKHLRETRLAYAARALRGGTHSLLWDVLFHDPFYILFFLALSLYEGVPLWLSTSTSFVLAVAVVSALQVAWNEFRFLQLQSTMRRSGFRDDAYLEARFYVLDGMSPREAVSRLEALFLPGEKVVLEYHDTYLTTNLPQFSGRIPVVRLRRRTYDEVSAAWLDKEKVMAVGFAQTLQVVYTRPREEQTGTLEQFRFFPVEKQKFFMPLWMRHMPCTVEEIGNPEVVRKLRIRGVGTSIHFTRTVLRDRTKKLYMGVDALPGNLKGCIIELKVRHDSALMLASMRTVMREFNVTQTTRQKVDLAFFASPLP
jgi:hypothetical protein